MKLLRWDSHFLLLYTLCLVGLAEAGEQNLVVGVNTKQQPTSLCPIAQTRNSQNQPIYFLQHAFEDGALDLAIIAPIVAEGSEFKRVTFGGSTVPECHYQALALARGGNWGWHLFWVAGGSKILSYARMDGEAWVSSPTKKLSKNAQLVGQPDILTWEQQVWIVWQETGEHESNLYAAYSADEGRSWQDTKLIAKVAGNKASDNLSNLQLIVKQNKPYLIWSGAVDALPLLIW